MCPTFFMQAAFDFNPVKISIAFCDSRAKYITFIPAIDMNMTQNNPIGPQALGYLKTCGYAATKIDSWSSKTRLLHDIGLCGDSALEDIKILRDEFGVDLTGFEFEKYFPDELSTDAFLLTVLRVPRSFGLRAIRTRVYNKYPEITLEMIESVLNHKKWLY